MAVVLDLIEKWLGTFLGGKFSSLLVKTFTQRTIFRKLKHTLQLMNHDAIEKFKFVEIFINS